MLCGLMFAGPPCICCVGLFRRPLKRSIPTFYAPGSRTSVRDGVRMYVRLRATVLRTRPVSIPYCRRYGHDDWAAPPICPLLLRYFRPVVSGGNHSGLRVWPPHVVVRIRPSDGQTVPRQATPTARIATVQSPAWKPAAKFGILNQCAMSANEDEDRRAAASASAQPGMRLVP
jgi:hypothetical protein